MLSATFGTFAPIDQNFAGIEVDVADLDVDELADPNGGVEEQLEHNLVLKVVAVLDGSEFLLGLGLSAFVPGQAKADENFSIGPVTVYRHHSPEWYRERERLRRREWREHQWREHEWREHHWRDYPDQD